MKVINRILERQDVNGGKFWSRTDGNIHTPSGSSTIDTLFVLGELGIRVNDYPQIADAVEFLFAYQNTEGSFRYSMASSRLPCLTARIIAALNRLGMPDNHRMERSYQWLLDTQWNDGGWRCGTVKLGKSPLTDASNPGTTLYVLDAFRYRENSKPDAEKLDRGVDFLLQHWEIRVPIGPCNFGIGSRFLQIEYPFLRYNIFYFVYVLSFYETARNDIRFHQAYRHLTSRIQNDQVIPECPHKAWQEFDFAKKGQVSGLATKRWTELKSNLEGL
jgi:hypothetical protein